MFNQSYRIRAKRSGEFVRVGEMLEELERRAEAKLRRRKRERLQGAQMELFAPPVDLDRAKPLADLFPEAYP